MYFNLFTIDTTTTTTTANDNDNDKNKNKNKNKKLSTEEKQDICNSKQFQDFLSKHEILVERALIMNQEYDITKVYDGDNNVDNNVDKDVDKDGVRKQVMVMHTYIYSHTHTPIAYIYVCVCKD